MLICTSFFFVFWYIELVSKVRPHLSFNLYIQIFRKLNKLTDEHISEEEHSFKCSTKFYKHKFSGNMLARTASSSYIYRSA